MSDKNAYKNTLNLPQTDFPMKASLATREPDILGQWQSQKIYEKMLSFREGCPHFILHDGPPYANGTIHTGHAVNKILKDIIVKFKHLKGFQVSFIPGWDCHGLPIELNVEKKFGKVGHGLSPKEFRAHCRTYADSQIKQQAKDFMRLGVLADWSHRYETKAFEMEADIFRAFAKIVENGYVVRGFKPVHWCLDCGSSLAEAEVEYQDKVSDAIDVLFPLVASKNFPDDLALLKQHNAHFVIWTTTPWTLPANHAVAVHDELSYALVKMVWDDRSICVLVAELLCEDVAERYGCKHFEVLGNFLGTQLQGLKLQHPLEERLVPVVHGDHVTTESGTGLVHIAPSCGLEDFLVGQKYDLPMAIYVNPKGIYTACAKRWEGQHIRKASNAIIDVLAAQSMLLHNASYSHSYPCCWRHKTPIIFRLTHQWFIRMDEKGLRQKASSLAGLVTWSPSWGKARLHSMLDGRPDWCISRQRYWGVPIALFVHSKTGALHPQTQSIAQKIASVIEREGTDGWFDNPLHFLPENDRDNYVPVLDVLDVWFDSGVTHAAVIEKRLNKTVSDLYLEGKDQYRGWFQSSLLTSCAMGKEAPYKKVITHGFVVDEKGHKMSKSAGNGLSCQEVVQKLGADVLRLWVASNDYTTELAISDGILKNTAEHYRRIRNTFRFLLSNLSDFNPAQDLIDFNKMVAFDAWILDQLRVLLVAVDECYESCQFHLAVQKITIFCSELLGGFYLDVVKDRLYTTPSKSSIRLSCQSALFHIFECLLRYLTPILSFTMSEVLAYAPWHKEKNVFSLDIYDASGFMCAPDFVEVVNRVRSIRRSMEQVMDQLRKEGALNHSLMVEVDLYLSVDWLRSIEKFKDELCFVLMVSKVVLHNTSSIAQDAYQLNDNAWAQLNATKHAQCARCWHYDSSVGDSESQDPNVCSRCITNMTKGAQSEQRLFF